MAARRLCTCDNRGYKTEMKKSMISTWVAGTRQDVARYTCPACGRQETIVDTHGVAISQAQYDTLEALTS